MLGAEGTTREYLAICADFGLTVSIPKTKQMLAGRAVEDDDRMPVAVNSGSTEVRRRFPAWVL